MTKISQLIVDAYQVNNLIGLTETPSSAEQAKAFRIFERIWRGALNQEIGEKLNTSNIGSLGVVKPTFSYLNNATSEVVSPYFLPVNRRFTLNLDAPVVSYLPIDPEDGARFAVVDVSGNLATNTFTIKGNGRTIETLPQLVLNTDKYSGEWFYRADLGNWMRITDLTVNDDFPLPKEYEEYFVMMINIRLLVGENVNPAVEIAPIMADLRKRIKSHYRQTVTVGPEQALIRTTNNRYYRGVYLEDYGRG